MDLLHIQKYVCDCAIQPLLTCDVDAGNSIRRQDEVIFTVADNAVLDIIAFSALTVAAVQHRTYDHLTIPLHACTHTCTHADGQTDLNRLPSQNPQVQMIER